MKIENVPHHNISTYGGNRKAIYAVDENGEYTIISSSGWEVEEEATKQALREFARLADAAYEEVASGKSSPLYFHMYDRRMDLQTLAQATGFFQWRVRYHCRPGVFGKLSRTVLTRYADALGIDTEDLCSLPERQISDKN